jgi:hypothetical protein
MRIGDMKMLQQILQSNPVFHCQQYCNIVTQYCNIDRLIALANQMLGIDKLSTRNAMLPAMEHCI